MGVNLKRVAKDLSGEDQDIRILALTTVVQLSPNSVEEPADLVLLREKLTEAVERGDPDTVFLARKGLNHVEDLLRGAGGSRPPPAPAPEAASAPASSSPETKEEALEVVRNERQDAHLLARSLASLARCCPEVAECKEVVPLLEHEDPRVRANAVEVVEQTEDGPFMIQVLSGLLEDENNRVRANVSKALGRLGEPRVRETLVKMGGSPNIAERESAVYAMGFLKGEGMVELLVRALKDPYEGVRLRAVKGLARHKDARALSALRQALNDMDIDVCEEADRAIRFISMESSQPIREQHDASVEGAATGPAADPAGATEAATDAEVEAAREERRALVRRVGEAVFELCRAGSLSSSELDRAFYDTLKFREFLRKHQERLERGESDVDVQEAMERLQEKIVASLDELGARALELVAEDRLTFDNAREYLERVAALDARTRSAG